MVILPFLFLTYTKCITDSFIFLLEAAAFISLITVVYFSLFELGIYFSLKLYHSSLFYLGAIFIASSSSWVCTKWAVGARSSGHDLGKKYFCDRRRNDQMWSWCRNGSL